MSMVHAHKWDKLRGTKNGEIGSVRRCTRCGKSFVLRERVDKRNGIAILEKRWVPK
jgi:hypothetical protein